MSLSKSKKEQRNAAIKRAQRIKIVIAFAVVITAIAVTTFLLYQNSLRGDPDVYVNGGETVRLYEKNGTFAANLAHGNTIKGKFVTVQVADPENQGEITVNFTANGYDGSGKIIGNELYIPDSWGDGHGHAQVFTKK